MAETSVLDPTTTTADTPTTTITPSWRDTLPDDLKADKSLESFKDVGGLAKSYIETKKLVGAKQGVTVPGDNATPEERTAYRKALGVPDTPEGYTPKAHPLMADPRWNKESQGAFLKLAHEEAMPPKAVDRILAFYGDMVAADLKKVDATAQEAKGELRTTWGVNYDAYLGAANNGMARIAKELGVEKADLFEATKGADPALVARMFHYVESQFTEHGWVSGEPVRGMDPEEARAKVAEIDAQLMKLDPNSERASDLVNQKIQYLQAAQRAA